MFPDWPIPNTRYETLNLTSDGKLSEVRQSHAATLSYKSDVPVQQTDSDSEELQFHYIFKKKSYLVGYPYVMLHMSTPTENDLDVYVQLRKASVQGTMLRNINIPMNDLATVGIKDVEDVDLVNSQVYLGPTGILRASHRSLDPVLSKPYRPLHDHKAESALPLEPGRPVRVEIGIWATGIVFQPGERLVLKIAGHPMILAEFPELRGAHSGPNKGDHVLHFGPEHGNELVVPFVEL